MNITWLCKLFFFQTNIHRSRMILAVNVLVSWEMPDKWGPSSTFSPSQAPEKWFNVVDCYPQKFRNNENFRFIKRKKSITLIF